VTGHLLSQPAAQAIAWALVHFLWQGALIGVGALGLMRIARSANARYVIGVVALGLMLAAPVATAGYLSAARNADTRLSPHRDAIHAPVTTGAIGSRAATVVSPQPVVEQSPATQSISARGAALPNLSAVLLMWLCGVALLSVRLVRGWLGVHRLVHRDVQPVSHEIHSIVRRVSGRLALDRFVRVCESSAVVVPVMVGWLAPVVLLPASTISGLAPAQIEALIAHELAHVRRHDYLVNLLQAVVETLLFYHPAVWWMSSQVRAEREHCCDDLAVGVCDRLAYVTALADLAALNTAPHVALAATGGSLVARVRRILGGPSGDNLPATGSLSALVVFLIVGLIVPVALLSARVTEVSPAVTVVSSPHAFAGHAQGQPLTADELRRINAELARVQKEQQPQAATPAPAKPQASSVSEETTDHGTGEFKIRRDSETLSIRWTGSFRLTNDDKDVAWIESGKTVDVSDGAWMFSTGVLITGQPDGTVKHAYRRHGFEQPYEPDGRQYLTDALRKVVRSTTFAAESRVARFLKQGGVNAVFAEISQLEGDYTRRTYDLHLLKQAKLQTPDLIRLANDASATIKSDYELASLLKAASAQASDDQARIALIDATKTIDSDYEERGALTALMPERPTSAVASALLAAATRLGSDYERSTFLLEFTRRGGLTATTKTAFFDLIRTAHSSYEQSRVLQAVVNAPDMSADIIAEARKSSLSIGSDYERRQVLMASMAGSSVSAKDAAGVIDAAAGIRSEGERANVLVQVAKKGGVTTETAAAFFNVASTISSSYEQHRVIAAVLAPSARLDDAVMTPLLKAAATIKSDYDRAETLIAVAKHQPLTAATRPLYLAAADGIHSDYDQTRTLAELVRSEKTIK
jgi:beta-lactamase regulating signal transducer with metallopeptidase domain